MFKQIILIIKSKKLSKTPSLHSILRNFSHNFSLDFEKVIIGTWVLESVLNFETLLMRDNFFDVDYIFIRDIYFCVIVNKVP